MLYQVAEVQNGVRYLAGDSDTRPWGKWEVLAVGEKYASKRITVNPGERLSLQYHHHREEHWTIVQGEAEVEVDNVIYRLTGGKHIFIPLGAKHRIKNVGQNNLVFIEVQYGENLDEDDIVRVSDDYGR